MTRLVLAIVGALVLCLHACDRVVNLTPDAESPPDVGDGDARLDLDAGPPPPDGSLAVIDSPPPDGSVAVIDSPPADGDFVIDATAVPLDVLDGDAVPRADPQP